MVNNILHKCHTQSLRLLPVLPFGYTRTQCLYADMSFPGRASGKQQATSASEGLGACVNSSLHVWRAVTSAEHINQMTVMGRSDLDRPMMQKRLPGDQSCIIFQMLTWEYFIFCYFSFKIFITSFVFQEKCFLHLPTLTTTLHANKGWASPDVWLMDPLPIFNSIRVVDYTHQFARQEEAEIYT